MEFINRDIIKDLVKQFDAVNTINGGISMTSFNSANFEDYTEITLSAPSVNPDSFQVYVNRNQLVILSAHTVSEIESKGIAFPMFSRTISLAPNVDETQIEATQTDGVLTIRLPFRKGSSESMRRIDIKHLF